MINCGQIEVFHSTQLRIVFTLIDIQLQPGNSALLYCTIENSISLFFVSAATRKEEISRKTSSLVRPVSANVENKRETPGSANLPYFKVIQLY